MNSYNILVGFCNDVLALLIKQYENKNIDFNTFQSHAKAKVQFIQENLQYINEEQRKPFNEILHKFNSIN